MRGLGSWRYPACFQRCLADRVVADRFGQFRSECIEGKRNVWSELLKPWHLSMLCHTARAALIGPHHGFCRQSTWITWCDWALSLSVVFDAKSMYKIIEWKIWVIFWHNLVRKSSLVCMFIKTVFGSMAREGWIESIDYDSIYERDAGLPSTRIEARQSRLANLSLAFQVPFLQYCFVAFILNRVDLITRVRTVRQAQAEAAALYAVVAWCRKVLYNVLQLLLNIRRKFCVINLSSHVPYGWQITSNMI